MNSNALELKIHLRWKKMTFLSRTWVTSLVITSSYKLNGNKPLWGKGSQTWTRSPRSSRGWPRWLNHISGGSDSVGQDGPWDHLSLTRDEEMAVLLVQRPHSPSHCFTLQGVSQAEAGWPLLPSAEWQWSTCTHKGWASHGTLENDSTTWLAREGQLFASLSVFWLQPSLIFWKMLPFSVLSKVNIWSVVKDELQSRTQGCIQIQQGGWELLCSFLQTVICNGLQQPAEIPTTWSIKKRLNEPFHSRIFFSTPTHYPWQWKEKGETKCFSVRRILYGHCSQRAKSEAASLKLEEIFNNPCGLTIDRTRAQGRSMPFSRKADGDRNEAAIKLRGSWPWTNNFLTTTPNSQR